MLSLLCGNMSFLLKFLHYISKKGVTQWALLNLPSRNALQRSFMFMFGVQVH